MEGGKTILGDARKFGGGGNFFGMGDKKIHLWGTHIAVG